MASPLRILVLLSGSGTTLENLFTHINDHDLPAEVVAVISSRDDAFGLERATAHGVPSCVVPSRSYRSPSSDGKRTFPDWVNYSKALTEAILPYTPDLICFAGFMCKYELPPSLLGKVMNIHPALIPAFCGKGMYGHHVHDAVVRAGVKVSGCTVHFVNNEYDAGPIILQRTCPVYASDTAADVQKRVAEQECIAYPEAIRLFGEGRLELQGNRVLIRPKETA